LEIQTVTQYPQQDLANTSIGLASLRGTLDAGSLNTLTDLDAVSDCRCYVIDLEDVCHINADFVAGLCQWVRCASSRGISVTIRNPQPIVLATLHVLGALRTFVPRNRPNSLYNMGPREYVALPQSTEASKTCSTSSELDESRLRQWSTQICNLIGALAR
jgi:anti-anti-sigma regulatory factor